MQKKFLFIVVLILGFAACSTPPAGSPSTAAVTSTGDAITQEPVNTGCNNPYFPVVNGATWSYSGTGGIGGDYYNTASISDITNTGFMMNSTFDTGTLTNVEWHCENGNLGALDTGQSGAVGASGVTTVIDSAASTGYNFPASFTDGQTWTYDVVMTASTFMDGEEQATADSETTYDCAYLGTMAVTVPAGTFNTVYFKCSIVNTSTVTIDGVDYGPISTVWDSTTYLAEGVGIVQVVNEGDSGDEMVVLLDYSIPLY